MSSDSLINRYRPQTFDEVVGHKDVVKSFRRALEDKTSHAFLFTGPKGIGKTSLSRLGALHLGVAEKLITEVNGAKFNGVDDMRALTEALAYKPLGRPGIKIILLDEAHRVTGNAWDSLLKPIEEPPKWVFWFICTTDLKKIPETVRSRCAAYTLNPVPVDDLTDFLFKVIDLEEFDTPDEVAQLCAKLAEGSVRQALSNLSVCYDVVDRRAAAKLIAHEQDVQGGTGFDLAKALWNGYSWDKVQPILEKLKEAEENPEGVRHVVRQYFTSVIIGEKDPKTVVKALRVLDNFSESFDGVNGMTPLVVAVGRSLFATRID